MDTNLLTLSFSYENLPADKNPAFAYLASLSTPASRRGMQSALENIANIAGTSADKMPWWELRYNHTQAIRSALIEAGYAVATVNKHLCALRGVLKQSWLLGHMSAEDYYKAKEVNGVRGETLPAGRELSTGEINALFVACGQDTKPAGVRDAAMLALLYGAGLRRSELVNLELADYDREKGQLVVRGKGNKERIAHIKNSVALALGDWLSIRGLEPGAIFQPINRGGNIQPKRMTSQAVYNVMLKRANLAGVKEFSPHDLRRTNITHLLEAGADLSVVADIAGHANIQTTKRYDMRGERAKAQAVGLLHVPYVGK